MSPMNVTDLKHRIRSHPHRYAALGDMVTALVLVAAVTEVASATGTAAASHSCVRLGGADVRGVSTRDGTDDEVACARSC